MRELIESFVCTVLPTDQTSFPRGFARDLAELAGDVTGAFLAAAQESAGYGHIRNEDVIAAGADVTRILMDSDDHDTALEAIEIAIHRGMRAQIQGALDHRFAHVAAKALTALADPLPAPLPAFLLDRAERTSSPVRKAVLAQLATKPHADHLDMLRLLTADEWAQWAQRENDDGNYLIARDAVKAIAALEAVPDDVLEEFIDRAKVTEDLYLMSRLLSCVVRHGGQARQSQVVEMSRKGSRIVVGRAAACALFEEHESLTEETAGSVHQAMVMRLPAMIASYHVLTMGLCSDLKTVDVLATALAASEDRRIFLALLALALRDQIASMGSLSASQAGP
ncbi:hypothetical protein [Mesorhizobium sp. ISC15]|uniref:hypothetical protein n=1 Tax=Mesorhizobium sp. ISC15 TaxID=3076429 RepID=UPI00301C3F62